MTIDTCVLEVDASGAISADDELQLCKGVKFCLTDGNGVDTLSYQRLVQVPTWTPLVRL